MPDANRPDGKIKEEIKKTQEWAEEAARKETETSPVRRGRSWIFELYVIAALILFGILAFFVTTTDYFLFEVSLTNELQEFAPPGFDAFMRWVSWPGYGPQAPVVALFFLVILYAFGYKWETVAGLIAGTAASLLNFLVKTIVARPRPTADLVTVVRELTTYSFPSGHVMFYTGFFGFLLFLVYTVLRPSFIRTVLMIFFGALVILVGISRVYLGAHWATDVLAGYLLGSVTLAVTIWIYRWGKGRFFIHQPAASEDGAE